MFTSLRTREFGRSRWAAIGAAVAVSLGAGGIGLAQASTGGGSAVTVTIAPERILDTRVGLGLNGPFAPNAPRDVQVTGSVAVAPDGTKTVVPPGASAVLVNVTITEPTDIGFLTLRPAGAVGLPDTSTVNFGAGATEPNAATVALSPDGKVQVWVFMPTASATAHVLIDVVGYTIDHDHDDRYYTEGEVDTKLAAKANTSAVYTKAAVDAALAAKADAASVPTLMWVAADSAGGLFNNISSGGISVVRDSTGAYTVTFPRAVQDCAVSATNTLLFTGGLSLAADISSGGVDQVVVDVVDASGTPTDTYFDLQLMCAPGAATAAVSGAASAATDK